MNRLDALSFFWEMLARSTKNIFVLISLVFYFTGLYFMPLQTKSITQHFINGYFILQIQAAQEMLSKLDFSALKGYQK